MVSNTSTRPPDSRLTGRPRRGELGVEPDPGQPGRGLVCPRIGITSRVAQHQLEVAADVEVIEQRPALRHQPS